MNEAAFREVISGQRRGFAAATLRTILAAAAGPYALVVALRNEAYNRGWLRRYRVPVPVVSVGNLTAGGTGKTPVVAFVTEWFQQRGVRVGILSRGYRAHTTASNDEKLVLDRLCPNTPHVQNPDRVEGGRIACRQFACQLLILDDGFQHRRLHRDLDVVLIDATCPWGYGRLLPRGLLREPVQALRRADLILLTRVDQCQADAVDRIRETVRRAKAELPIVELAFRPWELRNTAAETLPPDQLKGRPIAAFCGIGNPEAFRKTLQACGADVRAFHSFPDHHDYSDADRNRLAAMARECHAHWLVATAKDLVKLKETALGGRPLWSLEIRPEVVAGRNILDQRLEKLATKAKCRGD
ncbi:MAG: tetraacyldisaccharide 4'-kinase [Planctomycetes bacterium]|nr:tetraacyldisaccharide 4'-kinase [Planctomycetota bacterium]